VSDYDLSVEQACSAAGLSRTAWYRRPTSKSGDAEVTSVLNKLMDRWPRWGFWKCFNWIRAQAHEWNHKRVWRIYCAMRLNLPRRKKRMVLTRERRPLAALPVVNQSWSLDFMHDTLYCGKRFRTLNVIDEGMRECLDIEIDTSLPASRVVRVLERISVWRGLPKQLRLDNGPEFISAHLIAWCQSNDVEMLHIQPGKPNQNAYIERFNRTFRYEILNAHIFSSLQQVRDIAWEWMIDYNEERPHDALNGMTPTAYREKVTAETLI
jgi:putative transposase